MEKTTHKKHHHAKYYWAGAGVFVLLVLVSYFVAYHTYSNDPISRFFKSIYPASIVGGRSVSLLAHDQAQQIARNFDPQADTESVMDNLVRTLREQQLLAEMDVVVTPQDINGEIQFFKSDKQASYNDIINKYFNRSEALFTDLVIVPSVYDALLAIEYNSDFSLNSSAYAEAQNLLKQAKAPGTKFEDLALTSDDKVSGQLGGDLGFVKPEQVVPEIGSKLASMKSGEVVNEVVVSRFGYHILYLSEIAEQNGEKLYHLKHILVATTGYEQWLNQKLEQIPVRRIK